MAGLMQLKKNFKKGETVVVIFHDHGTRYLGKMFNDEWMLEKGFLDRKGLQARDLVNTSRKAPLTSLTVTDNVSHAVKIMNRNDYSQLPVNDGGRMVGSINENHLFKCLSADPQLGDKAIGKIMQPAFPFVDISTPVDLLVPMLTLENPAVLVRDFKTDQTFIITRADVLNVLC